MKKANRYEQLEKKLNDSLNYLSHAYLFVINDNSDSEKIIFNFIKNILTKEEPEENKKNIIKSIDEKTLTEIKEIKPDGMWIKKEQMMSLKDEFKTKVLNSKKRIYIIYEAEKLNKSSSNTILKFLEEPEEDIIAILITNNLGGVLDTIASRCQIINIPKKDIENVSLEENLYFLFKNIVSREEYERDNYGLNFINNVINFVLKLEEKKEQMICFTKQYFHEKFTKREEVEICFQIMILIYKDIFNYKINKKTAFFNEFEEKKFKILKNNDKKELISKIKILLNKKDLIKNNINVNLLIDSIIFEFEGVNV